MNEITPENVGLLTKEEIIKASRGRSKRRPLDDRSRTDGQSYGRLR